MATKKTETPDLDYSSLNVLQKLQIARVEFLNGGTKKTGKNFSGNGFMYFELADIVPDAERIFGQVGLLAVPGFAAEGATMKVYNCHDRNEEPVVFTAPFVQLQPIISNSGKAVTNEMQALGSSITYMRRYLWMMVLDIVEADAIDAAPQGEDEAPTSTPAPAPKPKKPVTAEERKTTKKKLTEAANAAAADDEIAALKGVLKELMELDPDQESFVQDIAVKTEGFTTLTSEVCQQLISGVQDMMAQYTTEE